MLRTVASFTLALIGLGILAAAESPEPRGAISVTVIDQLGNPVPDAIVRLDPPPGRLLVSYASPTCKTDAKGVCAVKNLPINSYIVRAKKPSEGYPDLSFAFYSRQSQRAVIVLTRGNPSNDVVFRLGPKAARLKLNILDDATSSPVDNPTIVLRDPSNPANMVGIGRDPDCTVLIPPDRDVQIQVLASNYQSWQLSDHLEMTKGKPLRLHSGEKQEMTIRLKQK